MTLKTPERFCARIRSVGGTPLYRNDFQVLADLRVEEAASLIASGHGQGAYYLCGYAVECALKACIAKKTKAYQFPPKMDEIRNIYSHRLNELLRVSGLDDELETETKTNKALEVNWNAVRDWTEESRYRTSGLNGRDLYAAVTGADGVLPWLKLRW